MTIKGPTNFIIRETVMDYEIGKMYWVPTVATAIHREPIAVMGPLHEDAQDVGFDPYHYHADPRFISERNLLRHLGWTLAPSYAQGTLNKPVSIRPEHAPDSWGERDREWWPLIDHKPVLRLRKCHRTMPTFLWWWAPWLQGLEARHKGCTLNLDDPICPHRGIPLSGVPRLEDDPDVAVCPGHGLLWNMRTGDLSTSRNR